MKGIDRPRDTAPGRAGQLPAQSGKDFQAAGSYLSVLGVVFFTTVAACILQLVDSSLSLPIHSANIVMPYLLGVVWSALKFDRTRALAAVILHVVSFAIFYIRPISMDKPDDLDYVLILVVFLVVAGLINEFAFKAREQASLLRDREAQIDIERLKNTLLRSVSHDLRSPLATIMGAASSLLDSTGEGVSSADRNELAQSICRESKRLDRQVANLLEMTSLESGGLTVQKEWYALDEILGNALTSLESALGDKDIEIEIAEDVPLVCMDGLLMEKVFINLIENCLKYAPDERYRVKISKLDSTIEIEVFNTGKPIAPGEEDRIFEKFYRGSSAETDGAGLGLAICQSVLHLHDGRIYAVPAMTSGVSIRLSLPLPKEIPDLETEQLSERVDEK